MTEARIRKILRPNTQEHQRLLTFLNKIEQYSEQSISGRFEKWRELEAAYRAYIDLDEYAQSRKNKAHEDADYPGTVPIVIPMAMGGVHAILAFLMAIFGGRRPIIPINGRGREDVEPARKIEALINYEIEHERVRGLLNWFFWFQDTLIYGCGFLGNFWKTIVEPKVVWHRPRLYGVPIPYIGPVRRIENAVVYEGNTFRVFDPFRVRPDPRVSLSKLQDGDFFGFSFKASVYSLQKEPEVYFNLDEIQRTYGPALAGVDITGEDSDRQRIVGVAEATDFVEEGMPHFPTCFEVWARIIPKEFGLSQSDDIETWVFTTANRQVIIRAEKSDYLSGLFPVAAIEYLPSGHQFLNQSFVENVKGLQDHFSWLFNSHMESVRKVLNNTFVYDPSKIVESDLEGERIIRWIRLHPNYYGTDPKEAIHQLDVRDVTAGYGNDAMILLDIYQRMTGVTDAIQGLPAKGRRTALEMGGVQAAASGRLKLIAEIFSLSGVIPLAKMMVMNLQQFMSREVYVRVLGREADDFERIKVAPHEIAGEFDYPVADGTYPLDKYRMAEVWREILLGVAKIPLLAQQIDLWKIFRQLGLSLGIKNIDDFRVKVQIQPDELVAKRAQAGNIVPIGGEGGEELNDLARILGPLAGTPGRVSQAAA